MIVSIGPWALLALSVAIVGSIVSTATLSGVMSSKLSTLSGEMPRGRQLPLRFGNSTQTELFDSLNNILNAFSGSWGTVIIYKDFVEIEITVGGAISYANATVDPYPGTGRNASYVLKNVFPAEYPFPLSYFPNSLSLSRIISFNLDVTSFVSYNIQPNGLDLEVILFIPDGAPEQDGNVIWVMDPYNYNYVVPL